MYIFFLYISHNLVHESIPLTYLVQFYGVSKWGHMQGDASPHSPHDTNPKRSSRQVSMRDTFPYQASVSEGIQWGMHLLTHHTTPSPRGPPGKSPCRLPSHPKYLLQTWTRWASPWLPSLRVCDEVSENRNITVIMPLK